MMCLRDTYYYWIHRLLHSPRVFRYTHRTHHLSHRVTPLTGFSVSPIECLLLSVVPYTLILFFLPKHPTAYLFYIWFDAAAAVYTHLGYEMLPRGFSRHWLGRWIMTSTAHQGHHRNARCNHGLYFLAWDRWMGTADKDYDHQFDIAADAIAPTAPTSPRSV
jgi:lathosterol oxidase